MKAGSQSEKSVGTLYIVPTPIGNLEDITFRAVRILKSVSCILAEDTRLTGILCQRLEIFTRRIHFDEHNSTTKIPWIIDQLQTGNDFALVSDAGSPGISDPGGPLIRQTIEASLPLVVLPGPSSVITALTGSGFFIDRFLFEGFLPRKGKARTEILSALKHEERTIILFESPKRLSATLEDLAQTIHRERRATVARELTKIHETWHRGTLNQLSEYFEKSPPRGEMVIVIEGATKTKPDPHSVAVESQVVTALNEGLGVKETARMVAAQTGLPASQIYRLALHLKNLP
ncbi:MAG: 16S rRNA ((1402)-2'-O)-methyltransferase [Magnetococcales bacterium]|nr:16S rRNA ((1402)-2'-O)-methyltransferase [Magnetococcales bacterium]HIJ85566.1 16S rRNA (cytidine(1402)-2'-O)-methyltransferase [Magnetococcales bacterium]